MALTADPADQALLLDLQALDTRLQQLGHRASTLPESVTLAGLVAEREAQQRTVAEQTGEWEDAQAELKRTEADVAVVDARIARDGERLQASSSVKDVAALEPGRAACSEAAQATAETGRIEQVLAGALAELAVKVDDLARRLDEPAPEVSRKRSKRAKDEKKRKR